jgi:hypothetical protein
MPARGKVTYLSTDEIIATIARSEFPSLVTEGEDDVIVLRRLEEEFADIGLTLIPAGGRNAVIQVFERRHTLPPDKVLFIADRDLWVISGVPANFVSAQLVLTDGYSIENDMFRDGELLDLLGTADRAAFMIEVKVVCRWFALMASRCLVGQDAQLRVHPRAFLDEASYHYEIMTLQNDEVYPEDIFRRISNEYSKFLRGKTLFALLIRHSHNHSHRGLLNFGASRHGQFMSLISRSVREYFT